ncbi:hypothetical protein BDR26DRAFT_905331 [Obelidium mucronatum]|nr:hypothetical protein BDR26DRAFT_905331 [Obelidium mucronatum]
MDRKDRYVLGPSDIIKVLSGHAAFLARGIHSNYVELVDEDGFGRSSFVIQYTAVFGQIDIKARSILQPVFARPAVVTPLLSQLYSPPMLPSSGSGSSRRDLMESTSTQLSIDKIPAMVKQETGLVNFPDKKESGHACFFDTYSGMTFTFELAKRHFAKWTKKLSFHTGVPDKYHHSGSLIQAFHHLHFYKAGQSREPETYTVIRAFANNQHVKKAYWREQPGVQAARAIRGPIRGPNRAPNRIRLGFSLIQSLIRAN